MGESKNIIYLFGYSINNYKPFIKLINIINKQKKLGAEITFVFMHDSVIGLTKKSEVNTQLSTLLDLPISFYILLPDLKARGINPNYVVDKIRKIEYEELVDLLVSNSRIISWL